VKEYIEETRLLDFSNSSIKELVRKKNWEKLDTKNQIISVYNFIRDDITFGYNVDDAIPASEILKDGYGQCNTKGILLMAILRSLGIPCRIHGFTIDKKLQKGAMTGITYLLAPKEIVHSWVEIYFNNIWYNLEGFILDKKYLEKLQQNFSNCEGSFCGYGVAVDDFKNPTIEWNENDTYIQSKGIVRDFGRFSSPDVFFDQHTQKLSFIKRFVYRNISRYGMNRNIKRIRKS
jgi:hypothetical protein